MRKIERVICWFSCGVTSAIATKYALNKYKDVYPTEIIYIDTGGEHPDNKRFIKDCELWFNQKIKVLKNDKYENHFDVFEKMKALVFRTGAPCTLQLKKSVRQKYEQWTDLQIFGFDYSEIKRAERFKTYNNEVNCEFPLIENKLTKTQCLAIMQEIGVGLPAMYKLGYNNNNCIGCVKGGAGYWNKIKMDFPEHFERMSKIEQELNISILRDKNKNKLFLKDLPKDKGNHKSEIIKCDIFCDEVIKNFV